MKKLTWITADRIAMSAFLIIGLFITACNRPGKDDDTAAATDNSIAETESNQVMDAAQSAMIDNYVGRYSSQSGGIRSSLLPGCASISIDTNSKSITIDFGTSNCECWDDKKRRGKILLSYTGHYSDSGSVIHITTQDYFVNDNKFTFDNTITNKGHNSLGQPWFTVNVANSSVETATGTIHWQSSRTRTWTAGYTSDTPFDDVYEIAGTASGTSRNGTNYTITITSNLVKAINCRWITKGIMEITPAGLATRVLDFGNGNCDSQATVTVNGVEFTINLN